MKYYVLIVEDESIIYERLRRALVKEHFSVGPYVKSYDEAIIEISNNPPDIVLLDINLQGKKDGVDLGKELFKTYKIPFIYLTELDDDATFHKGLHSNHEYFLVKTKPRLNVKEVVRAIHTVLHKQETQKEQEEPFLDEREGILGLVDYLDNMKSFGEHMITRVPVSFSDIGFFTIEFFMNEDGELEELKPNYVSFCTKNREYYFLKVSLKRLIDKLPRYFVRISDTTIVNISSSMLKGKTNGNYMSILGAEFKIKKTFRKNLQDQLNNRYHSS